MIYTGLCWSCPGFCHAPCSAGWQASKGLFGKANIEAKASISCQKRAGRGRFSLVKLPAKE